MLNRRIKHPIMTMVLISTISVLNTLVAVASKTPVRSKNQLSCPTPATSCTTDRWKYSGSESGEFARDKQLFLDTLFPDKEEEKNEHYPDEKNRRDFMKRLFIVLGFGDFKYSTDPYGPNPNWQTWPHPLAVALGHGQRVVIQIDGDHVLKGQQFLNLLSTGEEKKSASFVKTRIAASHGFSYENNQLKEIKLKGVGGTVKNISLGVAGKHFGINVAFGGLGSQGCREGETVGPGGLILVQNPRNSKRKIALPKRQHGHFYLQYFDASPQLTALMVGLEGNEAGSTNMFNMKHGPLSAVQDSRVQSSLTGGKKMACLFEGKAPAQYGGMLVKLQQKDIDSLKSLFTKILALPIQNQKDFFDKLLGAKDTAGAKKILTNIMETSNSLTSRPALQAASKRSRVPSPK